jgi:hypothetical protein
VVPICVEKDGGDKSTELDNVIYLFFLSRCPGKYIISTERDKNVLIKFFVNFVKFHPRGVGGICHTELGRGGGGRGKGGKGWGKYGKRRGDMEGKGGRGA